jgi:hypothetical protein
LSSDLSSGLLVGPDGSQITKDILGITTTMPNRLTAHREPWEQNPERQYLAYMGDIEEELLSATTSNTVNDW